LVCRPTLPSSIRPSRQKSCSTRIGWPDRFLLAGAPGSACREHSQRSLRTPFSWNLACQMLKASCQRGPCGTNLPVIRPMRHQSACYSSYAPLAEIRLSPRRWAHMPQARASSGTCSRWALRVALKRLAWSLTPGTSCSSRASSQVRSMVTVRLDLPWMDRPGIGTAFAPLAAHAWYPRDHRCDRIDHPVAILIDEELFQRVRDHTHDLMQGRCRVMVYSSVEGKWSDRRRSLTGGEGVMTMRGDQDR